MTLNPDVKARIIKSTMILGLFLFLSANSYASNFEHLEYSPVRDFESSDFDMFKATGRKALNDNEDGKESAWKNQETGNSGSITPLDTSTIDGMHCRKATIKKKSKLRSREATFTFCKKGDKWKAAK